MGRSNTADCWVAMLSLALLQISSLGCGNKQLEELATKAQQGIDKAAQQAKEKTGELSKSVQNIPNQVAAVTAGEVKLTLDAPVSATTCAARFTPPSTP